jgi:hypothetical protein
VTWISNHTALLALTVAAVAASLSLINTLLSRRYRRQDAYLRMHDLLTTPEMQRGRRLLYAIGRGGEIPVDDSPEYEAVNRVLAAHNNLAMYVRRGVIRKSWVLDAWHHTLRDLEPGVTTFINYRMGHHSWRVWTELEWLIAGAKSYQTNRPCCRTDGAVSATDKSEPPQSPAAAKPAVPRPGVKRL